MLRANYNWSLSDRIDTYYQRYICGDYCDLRTKVVVTPLTCSLGGATGNPWSNKGQKKSPVNIQITELPLLKKARPCYEEIDSTVLQQNLRRLDKAYNNFFQQNKGFPKFKNRSTFHSFTYATGVKIKENKIYLPKLGWVNFYNSRPIPDGFKIKSVTVRKKSNGYYISVRIEDKAVPTFPLKNIEEVKTVTGLEMGLGKLVYCSDSSAIDNPKFATNPKTKRLQRIRQRRVSRKKRRSNNRRKTQQRLSLFQHKIAVKRESYQASINIKNKAINHYGLNVAKKFSRKVRRDLPEPKQLTLFETPS